MSMADEARKAHRALAWNVRELRGACRFTIEEAS